jgi:hypothetical protein
MSTQQNQNNRDPLGEGMGRFVMDAVYGMGMGNDDFVGEDAPPAGGGRPRLPVSGGAPMTPIHSRIRPRIKMQPDSDPTPPHGTQRPRLPLKGNE